MVQPGFQGQRVRPPSRRRGNDAFTLRPGRTRDDRASTVEEKTTRNRQRGNYESGTDYVLEYGDLRFSFNEKDFCQRVEQAAVRLGLVEPGLTPNEIHDLLHVAVSGEIEEPISELGEHIVINWEELAGPSNQSFVHWIRRLVFRGAWLDQRVKEGELDVVFDGSSQAFGYVQPGRSVEAISLSKEPSWRRVAFRR
jgi:radical SAM superfamily enzyme YgiQ (UPF0313 family)